MRIDLTARDRRALTIGVAVLAPLVVWQFILAPGAGEVARVRTVVAAERTLLARERALLASTPELREEADDLVRAPVTYTPRFFRDGITPEARLREMAGASNVAVRSIERVPFSDREPEARSVVHPVTLRLEGESDLEGVLSLIGGLETNELLLVVESLDLSHQAPVESRAPEILRFELGMRAFVSGSDLGPEGVR
jgi:hypothetical protein